MVELLLGGGQLALVDDAVAQRVVDRAVELGAVLIARLLLGLGQHVARRGVELAAVGAVGLVQVLPEIG